MYLVNKCAISGKDIGTNDNVVTFPYFDAYPIDFEFISSENIALRSEFEGWCRKDRVVKMVRDFWIQQHRSKYFAILAEDENILIVKSKVEDNIRLFFLKYVFYGWFTEAAWKRLKDLVNVKKGSIDIFEHERFSWNVDAVKGSVFLQRITRVEKDAIIIPITEWQNLQELLSANK